jgi:hypothetical protein
MANETVVPPFALDLTAELARQLAIELDLQYDKIDEVMHRDELNCLRATAQLLQAAGRTPPEVLTHVLARASG